MQVVSREARHLEAKRTTWYLPNNHPTSTAVKAVVTTSFRRGFGCRTHSQNGPEGYVPSAGPPPQAVFNGR